MPIKKSMTVLLLVLFGLNAGPLWANKNSQTIYRCKDSSGKIVFQQTACDEKHIAGNTEALQIWRQLRVLSARGRENLSTLQPEVESIARCQSKMEIFQADVAKMRPQVAAQSRKHPNLGLALSSLAACGECRSSAVSNCTLADQYLEKALVKLNEY